MREQRTFIRNGRKMVNKFLEKIKLDESQKGIQAEDSHRISCCIAFPPRYMSSAAN